jgi:hypothetical protein
VARAGVEEGGTHRRAIVERACEEPENLRELTRQLRGRARRHGSGGPTRLTNLLAVIRLRGYIERGLQHPVLGPLLLLALALLVVFVAFHVTSEGLGDHLGLMCAAVALAVLFVISLAIGVPPVWNQAVGQPPRGPPVATQVVLLSGRQTAESPPLRL